MHTPRWMTLFCVLLGVALLGGCAFGRTYSYSDVPIAMQAISSSGSVTVAVVDDRPYVLSGGKPDRFVGLMRGGFGNPFDVNTQSGGPLAEEVRDAIVKSLKARGISGTPVAIPSGTSVAAAKRKLLETKPRRGVLVDLREWKSDSMINTDLHYDVTLTVFDDRGNETATSTIKGLDNLGSLGVSPNDGISRATARKFGSLFDDDKVIAALK